MAHINDNYLKLQAGYLFPEIARRVDAFTKANPDAPIIKLGIGDVTEPLPPAVISAMHNAVDEMSNHATFKGYGPEQGYPFLRDAITQHDYQSRNCDIASDEIFISDGSKCDTGNIINILSPNNSIAIQDPSYPVYVDTNVMAGNTGPANTNNQYDGLTYLPLTAQNNFNPPIPSNKIDIIYLCYPNNPTGTVASRQTLTNWVNYAKENHAIILFDAAYEAFIADPQIPHSIYEIPNARNVAIEFRSFSKNAGFTGTRCAFTVIPKSLKGTTTDNQLIDLHQLWSRRQSTLFNGVSYIIQRAAEAVYSPQGQKQVTQLINFYLENAKIIRDTFTAINFQCHGGINSPYIWIKTPDNTDNWTFFDQLLTKTHVISTPGSGFGPSGQGYFRISAFNSRQNVIDAMARIKNEFAIIS